ncbi:MAG: 16S rRNA (guanine(966)-N(2))-methyltransferase RsmD [Bacteroidales bacterium]|nr:16S rRNA (guanine(966)-N(2))-methyltransferase RsmD [Bacteroidales bacterium]
MRIISGKFKARRIEVPHNITARPTTDFAKEGLFNLLNNHIDFEGIDVLDLFAGTGNIGLEFVSRGARSVICVELSGKHVAFIRKICKLLNVDNLTPIKGDVFKFISSTKIKFDLIFADPPYDLERLKEIPAFVFNNELLKSDGLLVLEHSEKNNFETHSHFSFHRKYGNVHFSFFRV